jgi:hypothetical protein
MLLNFFLFLDLINFEVFSNDAPVVERLIFRKPKEHLQVTVTAEKERYVPGAEYVSFSRFFLGCLF